MLNISPLLLALWVAAGTAGAASPGEAAARHFEERVRPLLVEHCYACHSTGAKSVKAGLKLDSREGLLHGGESGPALVPGRPADSRLVGAIRYDDPGLQMPPRSRLSDEQVADVVRWVESGAPWPGSVEGAEAGAVAPAADLAARRAAHWAWRPARPQELPPVKAASWPANRVDRFILAGLERAELKPSPRSEPRTLLRRTYQALVGLPPPREATEAFLARPSTDAFARVVDGLLASPHFGERWARHWMDLVRYGDTLGNEADLPIPNAWRYRDYLVRAFNSDLPYDRLVVEHVAGDLVPLPRRRPENGDNESVVGTSFYWMTEGKRSPVDLRQAQADLFDNRIDVATKTFLGLTVACARCHDHKFDAVSQADYYGLYGYLKSSLYTQALLNAAEIEAHASNLAGLQERVRKEATAAWSAEAARLAEYLAATAGGPTVGLDPARLKTWEYEARASALVPTHPLHVWGKLLELGAAATAPALASRWAEVRKAEAAWQPARAARPGDHSLIDLEASSRLWTAEDQAFGTAPLHPGAFLIGPDPTAVSIFPGPGRWEHGGRLSRRLQGTLRSPTFTIDRRYLHALAGGRGSRLNVVVEQFVMIQDPLYGRLRVVMRDDAPAWHTVDLSPWLGRQGYLELADTTTQDLHDQRPPEGCAPDGYLTLGGALLSDQGPPPLPTAPPPGEFLGDLPPGSLAELAGWYGRAAVEGVAALDRPDSPRQEVAAAFVSGLVARGLIAPVGAEGAKLAGAVLAFRTAESSLPEPRRVAAMTDGTPEDEHVFLRGNWKNEGPVVPRRCLESLGTGTEGTPANGSGRLALAERLADPANPLTARAFVNRAWAHVFGRGLVATVDNLGALGERPTHPALLDDLAARFVADGWSLKRLLRELVTSETFAMSSALSPEAEAADPDDRLWHRALVRRLDAESLRDAILATTGRLDPRAGGPGVETYLTPFMGNYDANYGRPRESGPLDGDGRRSLYLHVRRNFPNPLLVAFDAPPPLNTTGRRPASNVPAQALILMNDPFVAAEAARWGSRVRALPGLDDAGRVRVMYEEAFARPPSPLEVETALRFLHKQAATHGVAEGGPLPWGDLGHVLFNVKEFLFVN